MSEETSRLNRATNEQQIDQSKTQGKFGKHPIACIVAGILLSLTGIGVFIGAPLFVIGTRRLLSRKATALEKDTSQANKNKNPVEEEKEKGINESSNNNEQNVVNEEKNQQIRQQQHESQQQADENEDSIKEELKQNEVDGNKQPVQKKEEVQGKEEVQENEPVQEKKELKRENNTHHLPQEQENSSSQNNKVENSQSNQNIETNQNVNSSDTSPQPTSSTTSEVRDTIQPRKGYDNAVNGVVNFVKSNLKNIVKCMTDDGTVSHWLDADGTLSEGTTNNTPIQSINTAKKLTDDELKELINGNANAKINNIQAWKDFPRNCQTINIYGTTLTFNAQNESYGNFMKRVADEIKRHETQKLNKSENDLTYTEKELTNDEKKQIEEKQIKFFRQILKHPGQFLSGRVTEDTYYSYFLNYNQKNGSQSTLLPNQTKGSNYIISLTESDTITVESTFQAIIIDTADLIEIGQNIANFPNRLCVEEKIIATIPLSEGEKGNNSKFTVNKNTTTFFRANTHGRQGDFHIDGRIKPVIAMEYTNTGIDDQPPTFTIKEPSWLFKREKVIKTLQLQGDTWKDPEKPEEQDSDNQ